MRSNVLLKAFVVGAVAVAFIVPLSLIWNVVRERYRDSVTAEVAKSTAQSQTLVGPLVVVRYRERVAAALKGETGQVREGAEILLPDSLSIRSKVHVETRQRGIYRVPVFRSTTGFVARFTLPPRLGIPDKQQLVGDPRAEVVFGVSDPRGIRTIPKVRIDGATLEPRLGAGLGWLKNGFSVPLPSDAAGRRVAVVRDVADAVADARDGDELAEVASDPDQEPLPLHCLEVIEEDSDRMQNRMDHELSVAEPRLEIARD